MEDKLHRRIFSDQVASLAKLTLGRAGAQNSAGWGDVADLPPRTRSYDSRAWVGTAEHFSRRRVVGSEELQEALITDCIASLGVGLTNCDRGTVLELVVERLQPREGGVLDNRPDHRTAHPWARISWRRPWLTRSAAV